MNETRGLWRGKRTDNGEWYIGSLIRYSENDIGILPYEKFDGVVNCQIQERVDPSTLGECTGLRDKNGKLIFEGDIVKTLETDSNGKQRCFPVVQSHGAFWLYDELLDSKLDFLGSYKKEALEIIGNIHDNPELLNGGSNGNNT